MAVTTTMANDGPVSLLFKLYCLGVMAIITASSAVAVRYTRTTGQAQYVSATAVFTAELIKLLLSFCMMANETGLRRLGCSIVEHVFIPKELLKLCVVSVLYALQNNMTFLALSNLDAATFQLTYQLKMPCTALCSVFLLRRPLSARQWISVMVLSAGASLVQWKPAEVTPGAQNPLVGFGAVVVAVLCSGLAGVYFEKVLKSPHTTTSLWVRNIQLYLSGTLITFAVVFMSEANRTMILDKGFYFAYTPWVWLVVGLSSVGGMYASLVIKYTDNIVKNFASMAAILIATVASVLFFGLQINLIFAFGALLVCVSICLYAL